MQSVSGDGEPVHAARRADGTQGQQRSLAADAAARRGIEIPLQGEWAHLHVGRELHKNGVGRRGFAVFTLADGSLRDADDVCGITDDAFCDEEARG